MSGYKEEEYHFIVIYSQLFFSYFSENTLIHILNQGKNAHSPEGSFADF